MLKINKSINNIEEIIVNDINDIEEIKDNRFSSKLGDEAKLKLFVNALITAVGLVDIKPLPTIKQIETKKNQLSKIYGILPSKCHIKTIYEKYYSEIQLNNTFKRCLIKKAMRSLSGVLVSTVVLRPDVFSCPQKCSYCPTESNLEGTLTQPKSYLSTEPAMLRALLYNFDIKGQIWDRITTYIKTGNIQQSTVSNKMEIIVSGGTWESYPYAYRKQVMIDIYWAANTYEFKNTPNDRPALSIEEEIAINETSKYRVIGLTLETRPDFITTQSLKDYRKWGVTRIQIGVQHYSDNILRKINRDCYTKDTIRAIALLKALAFKIVCHLMPDLPGSSKELDLWMFKESIENTELQFDDTKIYPTAVCKSSNPNLIVKSDILDWYNAGLYTPYAETNLNDLIDVLIWYKSNVQPWVRIQRLVRDIPGQSIEVGYNKVSNLRQIIQDKMEKTFQDNQTAFQKLNIFNKMKHYIISILSSKTKQNDKCKCIRCMEIGDKDKSVSNIRLVVRKYVASKGIEYFISVETNRHNSISYYKFLITYYLKYIFTGQQSFWGGDMDTYNGLIGFCRLRIDPNPGAGIFKVLENCALIREVHVYGNTIGVSDTHVSCTKDGQQHKGYGQLLVKTAEIIAQQNNLYKTAVIAGVGTREYYKNKCGYHLDNTYMIKNLTKESLKRNYIIISFWLFIICVILSLV